MIGDISDGENNILSGEDTCVIGDNIKLKALGGGAGGFGDGSLDASNNGGSGGGRWKDNTFGLGLQEIHTYDGIETYKNTIY